MPNGHVLELSSLIARHPTIGRALLHEFAAPVIVRLRIDPTQQPPGIMSRAVEVNWLRRLARGPPTQVRREVGWADVPQYSGALCEQLPLTINAHTLTEKAAIGIAALLIHDLEGGSLQTVLPIGSGGDYLVRVSGDSSFIQLEVSGLREDGTGSASSARLQQKTMQVLTRARVGFVSVTTFCHGSEGIVHSYHHFVKQKSRTKARQKPKKKPRDGKKGKQK